MSLTVVGENRQEKNRVGMEVQSLQVVMAENRKEELGKGRHQSGSDGAHEERVESASLVLGKGGANLDCRHPVAALRRRHQAREGEILLVMLGGSRAGEYQASVGVLRGAMACHMERIEADLEDFGSKKEKSEKGDLEQDGWEQRR